MFTPALWVAIGLALVFDFLNGFRDASNIVATMISSRAISPRLALALTAIAEFIGPLVVFPAVANTIGKVVVPGENISMAVILAALLAAIFWNLVTWSVGLPSSSSHALVGGVMGAVLVSAGPAAISIPELRKILIALFGSPFLGFVVGFLMLKLVLALAWNATPRISGVFKKFQVMTGALLALSHGTNDSQKTMGVIALALVVAGAQPKFGVPEWVIFACAGAISLGTLLGDWRLIRTLGGKIYKVKPVDGFSSSFASTAVIISASLLGGPVSTTQIVSSSILGVGSAERINKVRWGVAQDIALAWVVTIPAAGAIAAGLYFLLLPIVH